MLKVLGSGPQNARIVILGDCPGNEEEAAGKPFIGTSGQELARMLREVGLNKDDCYLTYACKYRPPGNKIDDWCHTKKSIGMRTAFIPIGGRWTHPLVDESFKELETELAALPNVQIIIGMGNLALFSQTGERGVTNWRGSEMLNRQKIPFVPTLHPSTIMRNWAARPYVIHDLKNRVVKRLENGFERPHWNFNIAPTIVEVLDCLNNLKGDIALDVETLGGHIVCLGVAWSERDAMCIPFQDASGVTWGHDEWKEIIAAVDNLQKNNRCWIVGQNWNYDAQYFAEDFNIRTMADFDTLIAQSVLFPGVERSLGFLASMYCDWYSYWKEDGKDWNKGIKDFAKEFTYNCRDCCATWEIAQRQREFILQSRLTSQFTERMQYSYHVFDMMRRGVNRDPKRVKKMKEEMEEAIQERVLVVAEAAGKPVNFASPKQVADLFFKQLGCAPIAKRGQPGKVSTDDEALKKLSEKYPEHAPLATAILECRSLSSLKSNFIEALSDPDGRYRSSWMATGTETFRLTSSGNAFHRGGPLQNITDGKHTHSGRKLPNLRSTIVPDPGYTLFNCDLERADLQVVVWEADDVDMKQKLREHVDVHTENAKDVFNITTPTEQQRHFGKTFVHLTNYGGSARTCAIKVGCTVHQADLMQRRWFEVHPGILDWHRRTLAYLNGTRTIKNRFGYRRIYFDRVDGLLPEALAWLPQSTVSLLISLQQMAIEADPRIQMLMQGHDSIVGQYRTELEEDVLKTMKAASMIAIPYDDPLFIPLELATSTDSWGMVEKRAW